MQRIALEAAERLGVRPGTFGLDRPGRRVGTVSSHRRACIQQLTAGPCAACVLAACSCRDGRSEQDQGPGRPGRIGLVFLIAGDDLDFRSYAAAASQAARTARICLGVG